jgi:chemotaxis response regulator CheB
MVGIEPGDREGPPGSLTGPPRDIVVIGASRGGVEAVRGIVAALPPNLHSTLLIVLHISPTHASLFPAALSRAGRFRPRTEEMVCALSAAAFTWRLQTIT